MSQGLLVVPSWERENYFRLNKFIKDLNMVLIEEKHEVKKGSMFNRVDMGLDELIERYGDRILKKAKKTGEKINANIAFVYPPRGYGYLEARVHYFSLPKEEAGLVGGLII